MTLASESLPLSGLKVLSVEFYGAGPFCTQYLSTFGADVIKIENSTQGGDFARTTGPNSLGPEDSLYFQSFNQGKRSLSLDLKDKKGKEVLHRLVAKSDVITNNLREGEQSPKMMSLGVHLRIIGRPGRIWALEQFFEHISKFDRIWVTTREKIAEHMR